MDAGADAVLLSGGIDSSTVASFAPELPVVTGWYADEGFDERRLGFGTIVELLRACQREGVFRLDRDRQGVLRVRPTSAPPGSSHSSY